jgi:hypothetical protein
MKNFYLFILFFTLFIDKSKAQCLESLQINSNVIGFWICQGTNVNLTAAVNGSSPIDSLVFNWSNGDSTQTISVQPNSSPSIYHCTVTSLSCLGDTLRDTISYTVNFSPIVNAGNDQTICSNSNVVLTGVISGSANSGSWSTNGFGSFSNSNSLNTTYIPSPSDNTLSSLLFTLVSLDPFGPCTVSYDEVLITFIPLPVVNAGVDQTVCAGTSVTLSGTGATSYTWNNNVSNGVAFIPTSTATYTVTGTNSSTGCTNTDQVVVNVNALPVVNAGVDQTVCAGTSVTLSGTGATSYTWNNNVSNGVAFIPTSTATYTVTGTNSTTGCSNTDQVLITINAAPVSDAGNNQLICLGNEAILNGNIGGSATTANWEGGNGTFTPNNTNLNASYLPSSDEVEAGFVVLTLTTNDPDGPCSEAENQMTITISPDLGSTSGPISDICQNSSWNLYENDCEDCYIAWEVVGGEIQGYASSNAVYVQWDNTIPNSYLLLAITNPSTGCSANDTLFPSFSTNTAPLAHEVLLIDASFNLLGLNQTNYNLYTWGYSLKNQYTAYDIVSTGNPYASYPFIDTVNYDYWVEYGELNQCLTRSYYNQPGLLGIETSSENSVFIYPNPFSGHIIVDNIMGESNVRVFNSVGALVVNTSISPSNNQIQTSHLQDGMYFVNVEQKNKSAFIFKLIKK